MAIRKLRYDTDPLLHKKARHVEVVDEKTVELIDDMFETMYKENGVGLAAPQVGILKRVITIDTGEEGEKVALVNPEILKTKKEVVVDEGCLSFPNLYAEVDRYEEAIVKGLNREGKEITIHAKGLLAQALLHEIDHLNGIVFTDLADKSTYFTIDENGKKIYVDYDEKKHNVIPRKNI